MKRITAAVLLAALATLTACSSDSDDSKAGSKPAASSSTSEKGAAEDAAKSVGLPPEPSGKTRDALLAALLDVNPALIADEDDAIDAARNQCMAINGKAERLEWSAQQRFSSSGHQVTEPEAKHINTALTEFCKTA
ncbi:hypothetical protein ACFU7X_29120 [Streptomyces chartreusis]|uniref:hypothetical protein n=1 Tax=Streptomyces chartreusis TaxID=1969 RepID=UPI0036A54248